MKRGTLLALGACLSLTGCAMGERLGSVGKPPKMTAVPDVVAPSYPTALGSMGAVGRLPQEPDAAPTAGSLYREGYQAFFRDQRAYRAGDIVTVRINISDRAQVDNSTTRNRTTSEESGVPNFLGLEQLLRKVLPSGADPATLVSAGSTSKLQGQGQTQRAESIDMTVAAIITNVLPNGNFVIRGRQEVRVNYELRELVIAGVIRPQDIARDNSIRHTQIAEARVSYGGKGNLTDVQQARWGQQVYDIIWPF